VPWGPLWQLTPEEKHAHTFTKTRWFPKKAERREGMHCLSKEKERQKKKIEAAKDSKVK